MNDITAFKERIIRLLTPAFSGRCDVLAAFPGERPLSLVRPALAVSLETVGLAPAGLGGFAGLSHDNPGSVTISLRFDFYEPGASARTIHSLYEALCAALLEEAPAIGLKSISCEPVVRENSLHAWRLSAKAALSGVLTHAAAPLPLPDEGGITHVELRTQRRDSDVS